MFTWLKRWSDFAGRSSRKEYWLAILCIFIATLVAYMLDLMLFGFFVQETGPAQFALILATFIPCLAVAVRRLHDIGRTGWWVLIGAVPFVGWLVMLVFTLLRGQPHDNRFGAPPPETPGLTGEPPPAPSPA